MSETRYSRSEAGRQAGISLGCTRRSAEMLSSHHPLPSLLTPLQRRPLAAPLRPPTTSLTHILPPRSLLFFIPRHVPDLQRNSFSSRHSVRRPPPTRTGCLPRVRPMPSLHRPQPSAYSSSQTSSNLNHPFERACHRTRRDTGTTSNGRSPSM